MKPIVVSDEFYDAYEASRRLKGDTDPTTIELFTILLLTLWSSKSPKSFEERWDELKRVIPDLPHWQNWQEQVENMIGPIRQTPGVMGGVECIGNSRIPVWGLVSLKKQGMNDGDLLRAYPSLQASDLEAAWSYYTVHSDAIDSQIRQQRDEDDLG